MVEAIGTDSEGRQRATNYNLIDLHQAGEQERTMADVYEIITQRILEQLEKGIIPWHKPWTGGQEGG